MTRITIHLHDELCDLLLADRVHGAERVAATIRQAIETILNFGNRITYAPITVDHGVHCAMCTYQSSDRIVLELDKPGTALKGRSVVVDAPPTEIPKIDLLGRSARPHVSIKSYKHR